MLNSTASSSISNQGPPISCSSAVPQAASTKQKPLCVNIKILNVNFQSGNLIDSADPCVIIGIETGLNSRIHSSEIFPSIYEVIRHDRGDGYGGVLLAIRRDYIFEKLDIDVKTESVFAKVTFDKNRTLIIGSLYRPPSSDLQYMKDLCTTMEIIGQKFRNAVIWLGCDLKLPEISWDSNTVNGNQNSAQINNILLNSKQNCSLEQKVTLPTRKESKLDLFLTNGPSLVNKCTTLPGIGDHDIVYIESSATQKDPTLSIGRYISGKKLTQLS